MDSVHQKKSCFILDSEYFPKSNNTDMDDRLDLFVIISGTITSKKLLFDPCKHSRIKLEKLLNLHEC